MSLDLTRLHRFISVYRHESFSRAAEELGMNHSALTKSIQQLEAELNVVLFDRTTRQVIPTEAGHRLAGKAQELLIFSEQVRTEVVSGKRHIRLITGPAVIEASLSSVLVRFQKLHPDVQVTAETMPPDIALTRLKRREVHALFYHGTTLAGFAERRSLQITPAIDEPYVAVMRADHPALASDLSLDSMLEHRWAIPGYDRLYRSAISADLEERFRAAGFPHYRVLSLGTCLTLAAQSDLITLLPQAYAEREAPRLGLECAPAPVDTCYSVSSVTLANAPEDPALSDFLSLFAT